MANIFSFVFTQYWFQNRHAKKRKTAVTQLSEPPYIPLKCFTSQPITATRTFPLTTTPTDHPVLPSFDQLFY